MYYFYILSVVILTLAKFSAGIWTYYDASSRDTAYATHLAVIVIMFVPAIVIYLYYRGRIGPRTQKPSTKENIAGSIAIGSFSAVLGQYLALADPIKMGWTQIFILPIGITVGLFWMYQVSPKLSKEV